MGGEELAGTGRCPGRGHVGRRPEPEGACREDGVAPSTIRKIKNRDEENYNPATLNSLSVGIRRPASFLDDRFNDRVPQDSGALAPDRMILEWVQDIQGRLRQAIKELDDLKPYLTPDVIHGSFISAEIPQTPVELNDEHGQ
jgi:hypothetical protein